MKMKPRPHRSSLERGIMRAPELYRALMAPFFRLPPGSRLRTAILRELVERSYAALEREDFDVLQALYHPDSALNFRGDIGPDYEDRYEGRDLLFDAYRRWLQDWGTVRREPIGFVDRGETLVVLGHEITRGESSGLEVDRELGQVFRLRGAGVAEQTEYRSWDEALAG